jgi:hypothetical protein
VALLLLPYATLGDEIIRLAFKLAFNAVLFAVKFAVVLLS